jgi:excisionase family DNA binding protein
MNGAWPAVLTVEQSAEYIGVSEWSVRRYVADGLIPTVRYPSAKHPGEQSRRVLIRREDLDAFVARQVTGQPTRNAALSVAGRKRWGRAS